MESGSHSSARSHLVRESNIIGLNGEREGDIICLNEEPVLVIGTSTFGSSAPIEPLLQNTPAAVRESGSHGSARSHPVCLALHTGPPRPFTSPLTLENFPSAVEYLDLGPRCPSHVADDQSMNLGDTLEASGVSQGDLIGLNGEHLAPLVQPKKSRSGDQKQ